MDMHDLEFASAEHQAALVREGAVSPVELTELCYSRIDRLDPALNAMLALDPERALADARRAEAAARAGERLGPLGGVPVAVKDNEPTEGIESTWGSLWMRGFVPESDSVLVERLRAAGAIVLGKTNMPDWGLMIHSENRLGDHVRNPWNPERTSGGSSSGAAAGVAAGLFALASGTDGGGSIRAPASFCGVFGIRPTLGRVPRTPGEPYVVNQFSQPGPIARTVGDAALMLGVVAGFDGRDPDASRLPVPDYAAHAGRDPAGLRVGYSPDFGYARVDGAVVSAVDEAAAAAEQLGCAVEPADIDCSGAFEAYWPMICANQYAGSRGRFEERGHELSPEARRVYEEGSRLTGRDYAAALGERDRLRAHFDGLFERFDLLVSPTMPTTAFVAGEPVTSVRPPHDGRMWGFPAHSPFTFPINAIGHPAASVPCGRGPDGMPIGLHVVGRRFAEGTILSLAAALERARPWAGVRPPVS